MNIWVDTNGWPVPPVILLGCLAAELLYFRGWNVLVKKQQVKDEASDRTISSLTNFEAGQSIWLWRGIFFTIAMIVFLVTTSAPVDIFSARFFWVHMVQHLFLTVVMAPILVASAPLIPFWLGLPEWARRLAKAATRLQVARAFAWLGYRLRQPVISCGLLAIGFWVWHWPPLYDLALTNDAIHDWGEHTVFLTVSILFWTQIIPSAPLQPCQGYIKRLGCIGFAIAQNFVLAVLLGFAPVPLYAPYAHLGTIAGNFSALQDQQLGAGIMWTFGDVPFAIALSVLIQRWLASQSGDTKIVLESHVEMENTITAKEGINASQHVSVERM